MNKTDIALWLKTTEDLIRARHEELIKQELQKIAEEFGLDRKTVLEAPSAKPALETQKKEPQKRGRKPKSFKETAETKVKKKRGSKPGKKSKTAVKTGRKPGRPPKSATPAATKGRKPLKSIKKDSGKKKDITRRLRRGAIQEEMRYLVSKLPDTFMMKDVYSLAAKSEIVKSVNKTYIIGIIAKMAKQGNLIEFVKKSKGKEPAIFRKTSNRAESSLTEKTEDTKPQ